jgi:voltage-gated potassium channel
VLPPKKGESRARIVFRLLAHRLARIGPVFVGVFVTVVLTLYFLERGAPDSKFASLADAFWFCVVTMSTVGYGDIFPVTAVGRVITGMFILFTLGTVGLLITAISEAIMEVKRMEEHGLIGTRMKNHVIICGFNSMARAALIELLAANRNVALLCETTAEMEGARELARVTERLFVTHGEPSQEIFRDRLNGGEAEAVIVAMSDDARNLIAALNIKVVNPRARLVVALQREELRATLVAGGVTYIASPNELSGRLVASAAFEPVVALLLEDLMSGSVGSSDRQQYEAGELGGRTVAEVRKVMTDLDGPLLVGLAKSDGAAYKVLPNPRGDLRVDAQDYLIVISDEEQAGRFEARYKLRQGRA